MLIHIFMVLCSLASPKTWEDEHALLGWMWSYKTPQYYVAMFNISILKERLVSHVTLMSVIID